MREFQHKQELKKCLEKNELKELIYEESSF
jgi:hypothetical protein